MVVVPLVAAPVIPEGAVQVHAMETGDVVDDRFTAAVWFPVQMP